MNEFFPRKCPRCGDQKNKLINGQEFILRCRCDWEMGVRERLFRTVQPEFYDKELCDWSPSIFKNGGFGVFKKFIKYQKANAIFRLDDFYYKRTTDGRPSIFRSIDHGRNLFIRGPINSGKGLLMASLKTFAASKEVSTTPLPGEWPTLKMALIESDSFSRSGEEAKVKIADDYRNVQIMTLENLRGEGLVSQFEEKFLPRKFRGSTAFDDLLTRRTSAKGSMAFTSLDFIAQIGTSISDVLPEILLSDKTSLIILLSYKEADELWKGLTNRYSEIVSSCSRLCGLSGSLDDPKKLTLAERKSTDAELEDFKQLLYLREIFPNLKSWNQQSQKQDIAWFIEEAITHGTAPATAPVLKEFEADKASGGMGFTNAMDEATILAVRKCKEMSSKLSNKECLEIGRMMSVACRQGGIDDEIAKAIALRNEMSGVAHG